MTFILAVDDDPAILRTLSINLRARNYEVETAGDGRTALEIVHQRLPDLILLDLGLPDIDGVAVISQLRSFTQVPIVVLSARHESDDKVEALDLGADDYVTKPFGMDELMARLRASLRHSPPDRPADRLIIETPTLRLDLGERIAQRNGDRVHLTPTEWRLIEVLTQHPGQLVMRTQLLQEVWGPSYHRETNYLRVYFAQLRRKLEEEPGRPRYFITEPGAGYRFVTPRRTLRRRPDRALPATWPAAHPYDASVSSTGAVPIPSEPPVGSWRGAAPAVAMAAWGGNHFSPLLLMYRSLDGYTEVQVNLFFAFYILGLIPGFLVAGPLSDEHGRRRLATLSLALGVLGSVVLGLGGAHPVTMCLGRFISGVSVATAMVVGTSWIKELSQHDADPSTRARRASLTLTAGFGVGAGVSGVLAQWGPVPTLLPYAVHIALSLAAAVPMLRTPETRIDRRGASRSLLTDLRIPAAGRKRFYGVVLPMAPWVFTAPALAFVIGPALVAPQLGSRRVAFAALAAVITLTFGAAVQPLVPAITRRTGGRQAAAGILLIVLATLTLVVNTQVNVPALALLAAALSGIGYGICLVAGLVEVQAMADPDSLAGLTGIYYSLTYLGFAWPVILALLSRRLSYEELLAGLAVLGLVCVVLVSGARAALPSSRGGKVAG